MAFQRPTLSEIAERVRLDFVSRLTLAGAVLRRSMVYVLSMVIAGAAHMLHGHLDFLAKQIFADTAEGAFLVRIASLFGIEQLGATFAGGTVNFTGTDGTVILIGTALIRSDGVAFTTDAEVVIAGGVASVGVTAELAGASGNTDAGVVLHFESPVAGADAAVTVGIAGLFDGTDVEAIEALRTRLIARMRSPPHGGNAADYEAWALEVAGFTRAWVYPLLFGAGSVGVVAVRDGDLDFIPSGGNIAILQAHLDEVRPVTAAVTALAPIADALNLTVHIVPDNTVTRAAVTAEIEALLLAEAIPGGTLLLSHLDDAIGVADGVTDYLLTVPAANVVSAALHIPKLGVINFV